MQASLGRRCEQFIENRRRAERVFVLSAPQMHCACALLLGLNDCDADLFALRKGLKTLRRRTPILSTFRGIGITPIATKLSMRDNPELWINYAKDNLRALKGVGFPATDYLCLAAFLMIKRHEQAEALAKRTREIYLGMRRAHRILTANEDVCFAVLLAMYEEQGSALEAAEPAFETLKERFGAINAVQMAANVLLLTGGDIEEGAREAVRLYDLLRAGGIRLKSKTELGVLAFLAGIEKGGEQTADAILETERYLRRQHGFSAMRIGRGQRLLFAACLVAIDALSKMQDDPAYARLRDTLQCTMLVTTVLSVVQGMAATGI